MSVEETGIGTEPTITINALTSNSIDFSRFLLKVDEHQETGKKTGSLVSKQPIPKRSSIYGGQPLELSYRPTKGRHFMEKFG